MSDIEKSFAYLQDSIPQWLQDIAGVADKVTAMQNDNTKVPISQSPFAKPRTDSTASIRPALDAIPEDAAPSNATPADALRHRPRTMVVVSYDGDMQKSFELLVRAIGTGRNMLRKAKMEARMNEMATQAESSEEDDDMDDDDGEADLSRINYRARMSSLRARSAARRSGRLGVSSGVNTPAALFDTSDRTLEQAQELCEKAAHLTLRDGDCRKELDGVRENFEIMLEMAKVEVEKCNARKAQHPPELQAHETSDTSMSSLEPEMLYRKDMTQATLPLSELHTQAKTTLPQVSTTAPQPLKIVGIEVDQEDDDDDDDDDFVLPPIRLTSRLNRRG
ncbi:hypothetical protein G6011_03153 [Alternaria panax]|uniref:Uncharacterized protein n=1 Tax=Alternaria panax TaxID=48097 RepID=A0AAD4NSB4_9PLEO|nr:hypothetical protein G6011_03153 [Alternaria panax]